MVEYYIGHFYDLSDEEKDKLAEKYTGCEGKTFDSLTYEEGKKVKELYMTMQTPKLIDQIRDSDETNNDGTELFTLKVLTILYKINPID